MARMTKAQREAAEEAARVEQEKQLRAEYPTRLMKALSRAFGSLKNVHQNSQYQIHLQFDRKTGWQKLLVRVD